MAAISQLPLFLLRTVAFPGGVLNLKVSGPRHQGLVAQCAQDGLPFGAIAISLQEHAAPQTNHLRPQTERVGVSVELMDHEPHQPSNGVMKVRCRCIQRFEILSVSTSKDDLLVAAVKYIPFDKLVPPEQDLLGAVRSLFNAINSLQLQGTQPFLSPFEFGKAGWVANRWCELLPIPLAAKQRLMELTDPLVRLKLVCEFLRSKGLIQAS